MSNKFKEWHISLIEKVQKNYGHIQLSNSLVKFHRRIDYWPYHWLFIVMSRRI